MKKFNILKGLLFSLPLLAIPTFSPVSFAEEADNNNVDAKFRAECRIREGTDACGTFNWIKEGFRE